jgi:hypothetical protein
MRKTLSLKERTKKFFDILGHTYSITAYRAGGRKRSPFVKRIINTTTHSTTGFTPAELMFGPAATLDRYIIDHTPNLTELSGHVPESVAEQHRLHKAILERARLLQQEADAAHLQETRGTPVQYDVGSYVLLEYPVSMAGKRPPRKLMTRKRVR